MQERQGILYVSTSNRFVLVELNNNAMNLRRLYYSTDGESFTGYATIDKKTGSASFELQLKDGDDTVDLTFRYSARRTKESFTDMWTDNWGNVFVRQAVIPFSAVTIREEKFWEPTYLAQYDREFWLVCTDRTGGSKLEDCLRFYHCSPNGKRQALSVGGTRMHLQRLSIRRVAEQVFSERGYVLRDLAVSSKDNFQYPLSYSGPRHISLVRPRWNGRELHWLNLSRYGITIHEQEAAIQRIPHQRA